MGPALFGRHWVVAVFLLAAAVLALAPFAVAGVSDVPADLHAAAGAKSPIVVSLSWAAPSGSSVSGYRVYVAEHEDGPYDLATSTPGYSFDYVEGESGWPYYFLVTSVDADGVESAAAQAGPVASKWIESPHGAFSETSHNCEHCHSVHDADGNLLLDILRTDEASDTPDQSRACFRCHGGQSADSANVEDGSRDSFALASGHSVDASANAGLISACSSCHWVHGDSEVRPMIPALTVNGLSVASSGPELCYACHDAKNTWYDGNYPSPSSPPRDASGYPVSGTWMGPATYKGGSNAHRLIPETTQTAGFVAPVRRAQGDCLYCHAAHRGSNKYDSLLTTFTPSTTSSLASDQRHGTYAALCLDCHGGSVPSGFETAPTDIAQFVTTSTADATSGHRIKTAGGTLPVGAPLPCYECHNPHGSTRGNASMLSDVVGGSLETSSDAGVRHFCFSCHTTSDTVRGWDSDESIFSPVGETDSVVGIARTGGVLRLPPLAAHSQASATSCYACHGSDYRTGGSNVHNPGLGGYDPEAHTSTVTTATITILGTPYTDRACADCHVLELGPLHMPPADCADCHDTLVPIPGGWDKGCVQAGCHPAGSPLEIHVDIDASHMRSAEPTAADTCFVSECHTGGGSLADIHANKQSCDTCHSLDRAPTGNCEASGCHDLGKPHEDLTIAHTSSGGTDFVSVGIQDRRHGYYDGVTANCSDCHITSLIPLHSGDCQTCHTSSVSEAVKDAIANDDTNCTSCHPGHHSGDIDAHYSVVSDGCHKCHNADPYVDSSNVTCTGCHTPPNRETFVNPERITGTIRLVFGDCDVSGSAPPEHSYAVWTVRSGGADGPVVASGGGFDGSGWDGIDDVMVFAQPQPYHVYIEWYDRESDNSGESFFSQVDVTTSGQLATLHY